MRMNGRMIIAIATLLSAVSALLSATTAIISFRTTKKMSQRQIILPLWEHISKLSKIDPEHPICCDIVKNINALELVALCCESSIIDKNIIIRTFNEQFIDHFEKIKKCSNIGDGRSGESLIKENRAAEQFYEELENERKNTGRIK